MRLVLASGRDRRALVLLLLVALAWAAAASLAGPVLADLPGPAAPDPLLGPFRWEPLVRWT
jgi:hypothetical protein